MIFNKEPEKYFDYNFKEKEIYKKWEEKNVFNVNVDSDKKSYVILMPPPNVTGILHMGHGLQDSLQDTLIRYKKMCGFESFWVPGKDHAGIATQNVVEKELLKDGIKKEDLGREKFLQKVWETVERHRNIISNQKKRLGDFVDWSKEVFTLDPKYYKAVLEAFKILYDKGLIYKGKYIVNWCPRCHTAISNEEVEYVERDSFLWYIKYPIIEEDKKFENENDLVSYYESKVKNGELNKDYIVVATTRPETMLGDMAVATNPDDGKYKLLINRNLLLPISNRKIPLITDELVEKGFGTGAVKVTPAHDPVDFEIAKKHNLEYLVVIDSKGYMNNNVPDRYKNLSREEAREKIVKELEEKGYIYKIENYKHSVGLCSRCDTIIEPYLSDQWFVKMKPLADKAIKVYKDGKIKIYPQRWEKIYLDWLTNIKDWCISRQLWWGHRIPVYYCLDCNEQFVSVDEPKKCIKCNSSNIKQDEDVLDTWFSSWLWPFATLGWPDKNTKEIKKFFPTDTLVSGYDILFFWVSRMIMASLEFMDDIPFKDIFLTGLIRDKYGRKMSKSLGNGIDPLEMVEKYGADAVRFTLLYLCTEGQDINLDPIKFEMGRNFVNKIWNSFKFAYNYFKDTLTNLENPFKDFDIINNRDNLDIYDKWILNELNELLRKIELYFAAYKFQYIASEIYKFVWNDFCDWYIEISKYYLNKKGENYNFKVKILYYILNQIIKIIHPIMPFVSEAIYSYINSSKESIIFENYPKYNKEFEFKEYREIFNIIEKTVTGIRNVRQELNIPLEKSFVTIVINNDYNKETIVENLDIIKFLTKIENIEISNKKPDYKTAINVNIFNEVHIKIEEIIDIEKEIERLEVDLNKLEKELKKCEDKLNNEDFLKKAKLEAIEKEKEKREEYLIKIKTIKDKLNYLRK